MPDTETQNEMWEQEREGAFGFIQEPEPAPAQEDEQSGEEEKP